jgi:deoxyribodipyrimidine photo-lyase
VDLPTPDSDLTTRVIWFRRDLRLNDHPALQRAAQSDARVVGLFVVDPRLLDASVRSLWLGASLQALDSATGGALVVRVGDPARVIAEVAAEAGADEVHISADCSPYGRQRDSKVAARLAADGRQLLATGSPYAVTPGRVTKGDGSPYRVYTPFYRAWQAHRWPGPAPPAAAFRWHKLPGEPSDWVARRVVELGARPPEAGLPAAGEEAALSRWEQFRASGLADYATLRDRADLAGTSSLSAHLRFGEIHPRTLLHDLAAAPETPGAEAYRREIAFREFYADVLWHRPESARTSLDRRFDTHLEYATGSEADAAFDTWCAGRTGFPFVDAGMRQLQHEGWIHNRVRMVVASFLLKDLHLPWWRGAAWFMARLRDGDLASNAAGWQWTAGCGTDASPYHRVFNPVAQGKKFDPQGDYVRRYLPELRSVPGVAAHEPWNQPLLAPDYPAPMVDHGAERLRALERHRIMKAATAPPG